MSNNFYISVKEIATKYIKELKEKKNIEVLKGECEKWQSQLPLVIARVCFANSWQSQNSHSSLRDFTKSNYNSYYL